MTQKEFTFDNFTVNEGNEFAHAGMTAVVNNDEILYNPLVICGHSGLGKTHLLQAALKELQSQNKKVKYYNGRDLNVEQLEALAEDNFTHLIIDDLEDSPALDKISSFLEPYVNENFQIIISVDGLSEEEIFKNRLRILNWGCTTVLEPVTE